MSLHWFALTVKPHFEDSVSSALGVKGYETFLPKYRVRNRWSDRIKELHQPLFPGYSFCRFDPSRRVPILNTPGVVSVVGFGAKATPVDEGELNAVRALLDSGLPVSHWPFLREGQRIRITHGPLEGVEGFFVRHNHDCRLVVSISLLGRSVAAEIESDWIKPV